MFTRYARRRVAPHGLYLPQLSRQPRSIALRHQLDIVVSLPPGAAVDRLLFAARREEYAGGATYSVSTRWREIVIAPHSRRRRPRGACVLRIEPAPSGAWVRAAARLSPRARLGVGAAALAWAALLASLPWAHRAYGPASVVAAITALAGTVIVGYAVVAAARAAALRTLAFAQRTFEPLEVLAYDAFAPVGLRRRPPHRPATPRPATEAAKRAAPPRGRRAPARRLPPVAPR
jgi:hypothetical protein